MTPGEALQAALAGPPPSSLAEALRVVGSRGRTPATARLARLMSGLPFEGTLPKRGTHARRRYDANIKGLQPGRGRRIRSTSPAFLRRAQVAVAGLAAQLRIAELRRVGARCRIKGDVSIEGYPCVHRTMPAGLNDGLGVGVYLPPDDVAVFTALFLEGDLDGAVDEHMAAFSEAYGPIVTWCEDGEADYIRLWPEGTAEPAGRE